MILVGIRGREKHPLKFPWLALLSEFELLIQTLVSLLVCVSLVTQCRVLILDGIEIDMCCQHHFVIPVQVFVYLLQFLLELLDVFLGIRVHLIEHIFRPLESFLLVFCPRLPALFQFDFGLDDVELFLQLFQLTVMNLQIVNVGKDVLGTRT